MLKVSETLILGYDVSEDESGDHSVLTVMNYRGGDYHYIRSFVGKEAEEMYKKLNEYVPAKVLVQPKGLSEAEALAIFKGNNK